MNDNAHDRNPSDEATRELLRQVSALPREIEPDRDLWAEIAPRLEERAPTELPRPDLGARWRRWWSTSRWHTLWGPLNVADWGMRGWAVQAAAALLFMSLGAGLAQLGRPAATPNEAEEEPATLALTAEEARGQEGVALAAATSFAAAESQYLRAKESLWLLVISRRAELSPVTLRVVERNLAIIDDAIRDLREALAEEPGNPQLESLLLAQHRRGIDLLQKLTGPAA